jgi:hypothetical protein
MYTVEWQKRGLLHIHLILWLKNKITPDKIDNVISAELSNKEDDSLLFDSLVRHIIHGPCRVLNTNSLCITEGKCSKNFQNYLRITHQLVMMVIPNIGDYHLKKMDKLLQFEIMISIKE